VRRPPAHAIAGPSSRCKRRSTIQIAGRATQAIAVDKTSIDRMHETLAYAHRQHHYIVSALERGEGARVEALMREHTNPVKENLNIPGIAAQLREAKPRLTVVR